MANTQEQTNTFLGLGGAILSGLQGYKEGKKEASAEEDRKLNREAFKLRQKTAQAEYDRKYTGMGQETYDKDTELKLKVATEKLDKLETQTFMGHLNEAFKDWTSSGGNADSLEDKRRLNPELFNKMFNINAKKIENANYNSTNEDERRQIELAVSTLQQSDPKAAEELDSDLKTKGIQIDPEKFNKRFLKFSVLDDNGNLVIEYRDMLRLLQRNSGFLKYMSEDKRKKVLEDLKVTKAKADVALTEAKTVTEKEKAGIAATLKADQERYDRLIKLDPKERGMTPEEFEQLEYKAYPKKYAQRKIDERAEASRNRLPTSQKEANAITQAEDKLKTAGITSLRNLPKEKADKYSKEINILRKLSPLKSTKIIEENAPLVEAASGAVNISPKAVGWWDNFIRSGTEYAIDEDSSSAAIAKYQMLKTVNRHKLFGATLTGNELKSGEETLGNLNKQFIPFMERLKSQLEDVKRNYETDRAGGGLAKKLLWDEKAGKDYNDLINSLNNLNHNLAKAKIVAKNPKLADDENKLNELATKAAPPLTSDVPEPVAPPEQAKPKDEKLSILERLGLNKGE